MNSIFSDRHCLNHPVRKFVRVRTRDGLYSVQVMAETVNGVPLITVWSDYI